MKIAIFTNLFPPMLIGGAERVTGEQARILAERGHQVSVFTTNGGCGCPGFRKRDVRIDGPEIASPDIELFSTASANIYHFLRRPGAKYLRPIWYLLDLVNPWMAWASRRALRYKRPEIAIFSNWWNLSSSSIATVSSHVPTVLVLHDLSLICLSGVGKHGEHDCFGDRFPCNFFLRFRRRQCRHVATVVSPSRFLLQKHQDLGFFVEASCYVLPNPVAHPSQVASLRQSSDIFRAVFIGAGTREKGFDVVARLAAALPPGVELHVAGTARLAGQSGVIEHGVLGADGISRLLAESHLLIFPSMGHENSPTVVREALLRGVGILAYDVGGVGELVCDGQNGVLIEAGNHERFVEVFEELCASPARSNRLQLGARRSRDQDPNLRFDAVEFDRILGAT